VANELVVPLMKKGICVVSDRGIGSAYAHAMYRCEGFIGEKLFTEIMTEITKDGFPFPDLTFFLSLPVVEGATRKEHSVRRNRLDFLTPESAREAFAYGELSRKFPNWKTINADDSIDKISEMIWTETAKLLRRCEDE
jgi:thymidylate kinase